MLGARYPLGEVRAVLAASGKESERVRALPAEVMTYYVIALGLLMSVSTGEVLRVLREGLAWMGAEDAGKVAGKAAIAQARTRLGVEPLRLLWERTAEPLAEPGSPGAFHRDLRLVALDGTTLDLPDTAANRTHFGKPGASRGNRLFLNCVWSVFWKPARTVSSPSRTAPARSPSKPWPPGSCPR